MLRLSPTDRLKLSPIERFWLAEDVPGTILHFFHKYELDAPVCREQLLVAISAVSEKHPLPFCRLRQVEANAEWCDDRHLHGPCDYVVDGSPEPYDQSNSIDPYETPALRVWYAGSTIWFQYHHSCADGIGALQLERSFFRHYEGSGSLVANDRQQTATVSQTLGETYANRTKVPLTVWGAIVRCTAGVWFLWQGLRAKVVTMEDRNNDGPMQLGCTTLAVEPTATAALFRRCREAGHTVNDAVIAATLCALDQSVIPMQDGHVYRVVVPINMRNANDREMPCVNKVSLLYLDVPPSQVKPPATLPSRVSRRMGFLKKHMGLVVWRSIMLGPKDQEGLRRYLHKTAMSLTCYASNLGRVEGLPACVVGFEPTPTLQHNGPIGLRFYTFRDRLYFSAGFDAAQLTKTELQEFLGAICSALMDDQDVIPTNP